MPSKTKKKDAVAKPSAKTTSKSAAKSAVKAPVRESSKAPAKKSPAKPAVKAPPAAASRESAPPPGGKTGKKGAAEKTPVPVPMAQLSKEQPVKKGPDYMLQVISHAREQGGKITFEELNDFLPNEINTPEEVERIGEKLRKLDIEIVRGSIDLKPVSADAPASAGKAREATSRSDNSVIDDPVRMYLKQMGQVPLLTREQEVEISKRIEEAEINSKRLIHRFGFAPLAYFDMIKRLETSR